MADVDAMIADLMVDLDGDGVPDAPLSSQLVQTRVPSQPGKTIVPGIVNGVIDYGINGMIASKPNVMRPAPQTWGEAAQSFGRHLYSLPLQIAEGIANIPTQFREDMNALAQYQPGSGRVPVNAMLNMAGMASPATMGRGMATSMEGKIGAALRRADAPVPPPPPRPVDPFVNGMPGEPPYSMRRPMSQWPKGPRPEAESVNTSRRPPASEYADYYAPIYADPRTSSMPVSDRLKGIRHTSEPDPMTGRMGRDAKGRFVKDEDALTARQLPEMERQYVARTRQGMPSANELLNVLRRPTKPSAKN